MVSFPRIRMSSWAVRFANIVGAWTVTTSIVFFGAYRVQVRRIQAVADAAQVVELYAVRNGSNEELVHDAMGNCHSSHIFWTAPQNVAGRTDGLIPNPALAVARYCPKIVNDLLQVPLRSSHAINIAQGP
jgi:hypothetical protein